MKIHPLTADAYDLFHAGTLALCRAEQAGIRIDTKYCERKKILLTKKINKFQSNVIESEFGQLWKKVYGAKTNINSNHQLSYLLYKIKKLIPKKNTAGGVNGSTDDEALRELNLPELNQLLEMRKLIKVRDTYLDAFLREQVDGWVHPFFNLNLVRTYRSCIAKGSLILVMRDFEKYPNGIPIEDVKEGDYVYCFDDELKPTIQKVLWSGKTGHKKVIRLHYSTNGGGGKGHLDVTPEHKIRLLDGTYVEAQYLVGDFRKENESKHLPKIRTLACKRKNDVLLFTGGGILESRFIYEQLIGSLSKKEIIHHKNERHLDHTLHNLKKMTLAAHSSYHGKNSSEETKQKRIAVLVANRHKIVYKKGIENPNSLNLSKYKCLRLLAEVSGQIAKAKHDFGSLKRFIQMYGIDSFAVRLRYDKNGNYIWKSELKQLAKLGRAKVLKQLGHNHYRLLKLYQQYGISTDRKWGNQCGEFIPNNHFITKIEYIDQTVDVYDIEVEKYHNFFANQICVHNSSDSPNFQNIPKRDKEAMNLCRGALFPRFGHQFLSMDFSGIEVRIAACVSGKTKIETIDGIKTIKRIVSDLKKNKEIFVYGYSQNKKRIALSKITAGGITRKKAEVWKLVLDNNKTLIATPDHKIMLRTGEYKQLKDLKIGDSLMPFYRKRKKASFGVAYDTVYLNNGKSMLAHNLISEDIFDFKIAKSNKLVHHKDGDGTNNSLENLEVMCRKKHMQIHSIQGWERNREGHSQNHWMKTTEGKNYIKQLNEKRKEQWGEVEWYEFGKRISDALKKRGGHLKEKNPMWGKIQTEETKRKISEAKTGKKAKFPAWNKGQTKENNPIIKKMAEDHIGRVTSEEIRKKLSISSTGRPAWNKGKKGICTHSEECKKKQSNLKLEYWKEKKKEKFICPYCSREFNGMLPASHVIAHGISYAEHKKTYNHKVKAIEFYGYEDVYSIEVPEFGNYAIESGIIIKNCYTQDPKLHYDVEHGDMHKDMAIELYMLDSLDKHHPGEKDLRQGGKNGFVFPEFYGDYYGNCAPNLLKWAEKCYLTDDTPVYVHLQNKKLLKLNKDGSIKNSSAFTEHVKHVEDMFWNERYGVYNEWKNKTWADYQQTGYIDLKTGFRCGGVMSKKDVCNYPFQGSAFHCLLWTFNQTDALIQKEKIESRLVSQIHDELTADTHPDELMDLAIAINDIATKQLPEHWPWINLPLEIEAEASAIDRPWSEKEFLPLK